MSTDRDYLAAGLALGGLSDAELAEAQNLADSDADFRSEVAAYTETMALMAEDEEPQEVSAKTREAILAIPSTHRQEQPARGAGDEAAAPTPYSAPARHSAPPQPAENSGAGSPATEAPVQPASLSEHRRKRRSWLPLMAAAAAVIVIAGFGVTTWQLTQKQNELQEDLTSTQQQLEDSTRLMEAGDLKTSTAELPEGGTVTVLSSESEQLIRFSPRDVGQAPAGKSMQMWVIGDEGPESAGLMSGEPVTIAGKEFSKGSLFGITVEPEGGSEQPTTDPIVAIDL